MLTATAHSFLYVQSDIPTDLTIAAWRASRPAPARGWLSRLFGARQHQGR